jgi:hypothetical protein
VSKVSKHKEIIGRCVHILKYHTALYKYIGLLFLYLKEKINIFYNKIVQTSVLVLQNKPLETECFPEENNLYNLYTICKKSWIILW